MDCLKLSAVILWYVYFRDSLHGVPPNPSVEKGLIEFRRPATAILYMHKNRTED